MAPAAPPTDLGPAIYQLLFDQVLLNLWVPIEIKGADLPPPHNLTNRSNRRSSDLQNTPKSLEPTTAQTLLFFARGPPAVFPQIFYVKLCEIGFGEGG